MHCYPHSSLIDWLIDYYLLLLDHENPQCVHDAVDDKGEEHGHRTSTMMKKQDDIMKWWKLHNSILQRRIRILNTCSNPGKKQRTCTLLISTAGCYYFSVLAALTIQVLDYEYLGTKFYRANKEQNEDIHSYNFILDKSMLYFFSILGTYRYCRLYFEYFRGNIRNPENNGLSLIKNPPTQILFPWSVRSTVETSVPVEVLRRQEPRNTRNPQKAAARTIFERVRKSIYR